MEMPYENDDDLTSKDKMRLHLVCMAGFFFVVLLVLAIVVGGGYIESTRKHQLRILELEIQKEKLKCPPSGKSSSPP